MKVPIFAVTPLLLLALFSTATAQPTLISPTNQIVSLNGFATFQVRVLTGTSPYTYAWEHDDIPIDPSVNATATNSRLSITNATLSDVGPYRVVVTDATGTTTSDSAELVVDTTFTRITRGPFLETAAATDGFAWGDYDNDGLPDLFIHTRGGTGGSALYRNLGGEEFVRVTNALASPQVENSWGGTWADVDNDGDLDLYILHPFSETGFPNNQARNEIWRNDGNGLFTPSRSLVTTTAGFWTDTTWVDHDGDGWLDLFSTTQSFAAGQPLDDFFFRNRADGSFSAWSTNDVGVVLSPQSNTAGPAWCDIDGDGDLDLYVSRYSGAGNFLFRNDAGRMVPVTAGSLPAERSTWGAVWADFNNDGLFDLFTGGENGTNSLHINRDNWTFEDVTVASGLAFSGNVYTAAAGDFDNDGDVDLFVPVYDAPDALYVNRGDGNFDRVNVGSPLTDGVRNGANWIDYDNDGFLDLFESCGDNAPALNLLYRNSLPQYGNTNHWLKVRLRGTVSNASAIGARVWVRALISGKETWQVRQVTSGCLVAAATDGLRLHFGLGDATAVDLLRIEWPSGNVSELTGVAVDQLLAITEPGVILPARPSASLGGSIQLTSRTGRDVQWFHNGVLLEGETNRTLNLTHVQAADAGRYCIVIATTTGFTTNYTYVDVDNRFTKVTGEPWETDLGTSNVAVGDYDGDEYLDVFVGRYRTGQSALYRNNGDGTFQSLTNATFPLAVGDYWFGPCSDFDNDGRTDVLAVRPDGTDPSQFLYSNGDGTFVPSLLATVSPWWQHSVDYDHDGWLDLYLTSWGAGQTNRLYRNFGGRDFQILTRDDVGAILGPRSFGNAAWADYDDDGWEDVAMPDITSSRCRLYRNLGTGRFEAVTNQITQTSLPSALVASWGDYNNDGRVDLFVAGSMNVLFKNLGDGNFERVTFPVPVQGFYNGASWGDYDNDGFLDLFMTFGNGQGNDLFRNNGDGTFTTIVLGSIVNDNVAPDASYAGLWFDYDNNGFLDLLVPNGNDAGTAVVPNFLYRNNGNSNAWLKVKLVGTTSNREGAGAKVRVLASIAGSRSWQRRDITSGGDPYSGNGPIAHFGLGNATVVTRLQIEWPSGTVQEFSTVATNQFLTIVEPRRPVMTAAITAEGLFEVEFTTESDRTYGLQGSDDLVSWTVLETFTGTGAPMRWAETLAALHRFYRVVYR